MNTGLLFEIAGIIVGLVYLTYMLYFRFSQVQVNKYKKLTGKTKDDYLRMFTNTRIGITALLTVLFIADFVRRLISDKNIDTGAVLLFVGLIVAIGIATFISVYTRFSEENKAK